MELNFKSYTGTKTVKAMPMCANKAKSEGANVPEKYFEVGNASYNPGADGYLVEYEGGYRSWSPAPVFEEAYRPSETFVERLRIEYKELGKRIQRATNCLYEPYVPLTDNELRLLSMQVDAMVCYYKILRKRLSEYEAAENKRYRLETNNQQNEDNNGNVD